MKNTDEFKLKYASDEHCCGKETVSVRGDVKEILVYQHSCIKRLALYWICSFTKY